jgi:hypothetical protein
VKAEVGTDYDMVEMNTIFYGHFHHQICFGFFTIHLSFYVSVCLHSHRKVDVLDNANDYVFFAKINA